MTLVIVLTKAQADAVRSEPAPGYVLDPVPYGTKFIVGVEVLTDKAHAAKWEFLENLPQQDIQTEESDGEQ